MEKYFTWNDLDCKKDDSADRVAVVPNDKFSSHSLSGQCVQTRGPHGSISTMLGISEVKTASFASLSVLKRR